MLEGHRTRATRILFFAPEIDLSRFVTALRRANYEVEVAADECDAMERLARAPSVDLIVVYDTDPAGRAAVVREATTRGAWGVHVAGADGSPLSPDERASIVAAIRFDASDSQIVATVDLVLAAREARSSLPEG